VCVFAPARRTKKPSSRTVSTEEPKGRSQRATCLFLCCEEAPHPARPGSGHGANRICSNAALAGSTGAGLFPVGAASVKEIFAGDGSIRLYAVALKVAAEPGGDSWYWFEGSRGDVIANGEGDGTCTGCHSRAPQDFLYTVVR
jgi:hypothetical protein